MISFFDTGAHMLYDVEGIFEGSQDRDMSFCMANSACRQGAGYILLTPGSTAFANHREKIRMNYKAFRADVRACFPALQLGIGTEILCDCPAQEIVRDLKQGRLLTLNWTNYVLLRFPEGIGLDALWGYVQAMTESGFVPVISRVQDCGCLMWRHDEVRKLKERGCLLQLTTTSLHDSAPHVHWSRELLRSHQVDLLATDMKNTYTDPPKILDAVKYLSAHCQDGDYVRAITWENAWRLFAHSVAGR